MPNYSASRASASVSTRAFGRRGVAPALVFSCMCAGMVPVAPAVGAVQAYPRLVHW